MATAIVEMFGRFQQFCDEYGDPRTQNLPLVGSPWPTVTIVAVYLFLVKYLLPKLMKNRKPFVLRNTIYYYNVCQILISLFSLMEAVTIGFFTQYSWRCQPVETDTSPATKRLLCGAWTWYMLKYIELLDTIFFVLRKKDNQVSKLHLFHHSIMPINTWVAIRFVPGGHATFAAVINSFVHFVMYGYYLLAGLGPGVAKYLWWKRYVTTLQIGQFVLIFVHMMQPLFIDCGFPRAFAYYILFNAFLFFVLFNHFYFTAYKFKPQESTRPESTNNDGNTVLHPQKSIANGIKESKVE